MKKIILIIFGNGKVPENEYYSRIIDIKYESKDSLISVLDKIKTEINDKNLKIFSGNVDMLPDCYLKVEKNFCTLYIV